MRRVMYLWLQRWPIDRWRRSRASTKSAASADGTPFATVVDSAGQRLLAAVDEAAVAAGLAPGMPLADALSYVPGLAIAAAEPASDAAALRRLAEWCGRYSPWTAPDGADGIKIEITGSAHLWGGEAALAADLASRLDRQAIVGRIAIADTLGAAWALARFAEPDRNLVVQPLGRARVGLTALPVEALRLDPATAQELRRVGLKRVGDLYAMPRAVLARRFGENVIRRLDQALGSLPEPLSPLGETPVRRVRLSWPEPIADPADLARATERLAADLVLRLAREGMGARRLDLGFYRVDGRVEHIRIGTARPSRDPGHLAALFNTKLDTVDPGFGIEDMILAAFAVEPLDAEQLGLIAPRPIGGEVGSAAALLDRLGNRLGADAVYRLEARESHVPERASVRVSPSSGKPPAIPAPTPILPRLRGRAGEGRNPERPPVSAGIGRGPRPIRLFDPPEPVEAFWLLPDEPPFRFTWRRRAHRVRRADGPERIAEEWWRAAPGAIDTVRDYYRVEDEEGRRFWLFRAGLAGSNHPPRWFIHGLFA